MMGEHEKVILKAFAGRLKEWRTETGKSQAQAEDMCGLQHRAWSRYESGQQAPGLLPLRRISEGTGLDVDELLFGARS